MPETRINTSLATTPSLNNNQPVQSDVNKSESMSERKGLFSSLVSYVQAHPYQIALGTMATFGASYGLYHLLGNHPTLGFSAFSSTVSVNPPPVTKNGMTCGFLDGLKGLRCWSATPPQSTATAPATSPPVTKNGMTCGFLDGLKGLRCWSATPQSTATAPATSPPVTKNGMTCGFLPDLTGLRCWSATPQSAAAASETPPPVTKNGMTCGFLPDLTGLRCWLQHPQDIQDKTTTVSTPHMQNAPAPSLQTQNVPAPALEPSLQMPSQINTATPQKAAINTSTPTTALPLLAMPKVEMPPSEQGQAVYQKNRTATALTPNTQNAPTPSLQPQMPSQINTATPQKATGTTSTYTPPSWTTKIEHLSAQQSQEAYDKLNILQKPQDPLFKAIEKADSIGSKALALFSYCEEYRLICGTVIAAALYKLGLLGSLFKRILGAFQGGGNKMIPSVRGSLSKEDIYIKGLRQNIRNKQQQQQTNSEPNSLHDHARRDYSSSLLENDEEFKMNGNPNSLYSPSSSHSSSPNIKNTDSSLLGNLFDEHKLSSSPTSTSSTGSVSGTPLMSPRIREAQEIGDWEKGGLIREPAPTLQTSQIFNSAEWHYFLKGYFSEEKKESH